MQRGDFFVFLGSLTWTRNSELRITHKVVEKRRQHGLTLPLRSRGEKSAQTSCAVQPLRLDAKRCRRLLQTIFEGDRDRVAGWESILECFVEKRIKAIKLGWYFDLRLGVFSFRRHVRLFR